MSLNVALVTATPPGFNPGMLFSQVVARSFLERHGLSRKTIFYRLVSMNQRLSHLEPSEQFACLARIDDGITYHLIESTDQLKDAIPFYWGDLLHMHQYLNSIRDLIRNGHVTPENLLLLKDAPDEVLSRAVSFGTTFLFHDAFDIIDNPFGAAFQRFIRGAKRVLPRDMVSLSQIAAMLPQAPMSLGLDATQLVCRMENWRDVFPEGTDTSIAVADVGLCYFARGNHTVENLKNAIALLSLNFAMPVRWLPWGDRLSFPHLGDYEGKLGLETLAGVMKPRLSALLEAVAKAAFVVTDTYHLAVIAWSLGTPALTLRGRHWEGDFNAVVDKRYIFHVQHGLQDFFHDEGAADKHQLDQIVRRFAEYDRIDKALAWYKKNVSARAQWCEQQLIQALKD